MWLKTVKRRGRFTEQTLGRNCSSPTVLRGPTYVCEEHICVVGEPKLGKEPPERTREHTTYYSCRARDNDLSNHKLDRKLCNSVDAQ